MTRTPSDLTRDELVALVEGLREMMYGSVDDDGRSTWDLDQAVAGAELVAWVSEELSRLGLVPKAGPRM